MFDTEDDEIELDIDKDDDLIKTEDNAERSKHSYGGRKKFEVGRYFCVQNSSWEIEQRNLIIGRNVLFDEQSKFRGG